MAGQSGRTRDLTQDDVASNGLRQTVWSARRLARKLARVAVGIGPAVEPQLREAPVMNEGSWVGLDVRLFGDGRLFAEGVEQGEVGLILGSEWRAVYVHRVVRLRFDLRSKADNRSREAADPAAWRAQRIRRPRPIAPLPVRDQRPVCFALDERQRHRDAL